MAHDQTQVQRPEKGQEEHKASEKRPEGAQITTRDDNNRQEGVKKADALRSFKLTKEGQNSFTIVSDSKEEIKDTRALRRDHSDAPKPKHREQHNDRESEKHHSGARRTRSESIGPPTLEPPSKNDATYRISTESHTVAGTSGETGEVTTTKNTDGTATETTSRQNGDKVRVEKAWSHDRVETSQTTAADARVEAPKRESSDAAPSDHPWEDKRRDQLIDKYVETNHLTRKDAEKRADEDIAATKKVIELKVQDFERNKKAELVNEYLKEHKSPQEANQLADDYIAKSRHKIEENVERFEVERREQLERMYTAKGEKPDRAIVYAEKEITDTHVQSAEDIAQFETVRRDQLERIYTAQNPKLTLDQCRAQADKEINDTYGHVFHLVEQQCQWQKTDKTGKHLGLDASDRINLAQEVIHQVAHPTLITQGDHNTCNATTVETTTYARHPSEAARLVDEVAISATYTTTTSPHIKIDVPKENIEYHHKADDMFHGMRRSFASQIFQTTAINVYYIGRHSSIQYTQTDQYSGRGDTGERLTDYSTKPPHVMKGHTPGVAANPGHFFDVQTQITGEHGELLTAIERATDKGHPEVKHVQSRQQLQHLLEDAKRDGKFPITVEVDGRSEPFRSEGKVTGPPWGSHVVTICGYDNAAPGNPMVYVDNQWSPGFDHLQGMDAEHQHTGLDPLSLQAMFEAMRPPYKNDNDIGSQLEQRRLHGDLQGALQKAQYIKELAILQKRLTHDWPTLSATEKAHLNQQYQHLLTLR